MLELKLDPQTGNSLLKVSKKTERKAYLNNNKKSIKIFKTFIKII